MRRLITLSVVLFALASPRMALACPSCADAIPNESGTEEQDQVRLARAYNNSILLMVGMPYVALGAVGLMVYRQLRARAAVQNAVIPPARPVSPDDVLSPPSGDPACPPPSHDEVS